jgi:hypothetical protein
MTLSSALDINEYGYWHGKPPFVTINLNQIDLSKVWVDGNASITASFQ